MINQKKLLSQPDIGPYIELKKPNENFWSISTGLYSGRYEIPEPDLSLPEGLGLQLGGGLLDYTPLPTMVPTLFASPKATIADYWFTLQGKCEQTLKANQEFQRFKFLMALPPLLDQLKEKLDAVGIIKVLSTMIDLPLPLDTAELLSEDFLTKLDHKLHSLTISQLLLHRGKRTRLFDSEDPILQFSGLVRSTALCAFPLNKFTQKLFCYDTLKFMDVLQHWNKPAVDAAEAIGVPQLLTQLSYIFTEEALKMKTLFELAKTCQYFAYTKYPLTEETHRTFNVIHRHVFDDLMKSPRDHYSMISKDLEAAFFPE